MLTAVCHYNEFRTRVELRQEGEARTESTQREATKYAHGNENSDYGDAESYLDLEATKRVYKRPRPWY